MRFADNLWALILGGSSGFGLATAKKLARHGLNVAIVHRDRRGAMGRIEAEFRRIRECGVGFVSINSDALSATGRAHILAQVRQTLGDTGRLRVLLHSIALGNLKPLAGWSGGERRKATVMRLARELNQPTEAVEVAIARLSGGGGDLLHGLAPAPDYGRHRLAEEDFAATIHNMGTNLVAWVQDALEAGLFADDARILGLTSEGNTTAWRGYAAIAAAKVTLESLSRSMALEFAPFGLRSNVIQAGISETPASALIPGIEKMKAQARLRNPFGRLTTPEDVANLVFLLCQDEAAWVNGSIIRVDGGEHISGGNY